MACPRQEDANAMVWHEAKASAPPSASTPRLTPRSQQHPEQEVQTSIVEPKPPSMALS